MDSDNRRPVYVVASILGVISLGIIAADLWLRSQHLEGLTAGDLYLPGLVVVGLLGWLAPSPLRNPAQQANAVEVAAPLEVGPVEDPAPPELDAEAAP